RQLRVQVGPPGAPRPAERAPALGDRLGGGGGLGGGGRRSGRCNGSRGDRARGAAGQQGAAADDGARRSCAGEKRATRQSVTSVGGRHSVLGHGPFLSFRVGRRWETRLPGQTRRGGGARGAHGGGAGG